MKILAFILITILSFTPLAEARTPDSIQLRIGQSRTVQGGKVTVKFVAVGEDSRCPVNARCVWAGNAKITVAVSLGKGAPKIIELNSGVEPRATVISGYEIKFVDLTPRPGETATGPKTATISVNKTL